MRYLIVLFLMAYCILSFAQERALVKVHYKFRHVNDTSRRNQPLRDDVVTYLGRFSSLYMSNTDNLLKADLDAQKLVSDYTGHLVVRLSTTPVQDFYLIDRNRLNIKRIQAISSSFDIYVLDQAYEMPTWEIYDEQKEIGGYLCQKATTTFKGRNYTAWFAPDLPFYFGPWKLHGLPGLILSAADEKDEVSFEYNGFDKLEEEEIVVEVPYYAIQAGQNEIDRLKKVFVEDQSNYYKTMVSSGRFSLGSDFYGIDYNKNTVDLKADDDYKPSFKTNNPIEIVK